MGVSCSADRNIKAKINRDGIWIEKLEHNRRSTFAEALRTGEGDAVSINLNQPMSSASTALDHPVSTRLAEFVPLLLPATCAHAELKRAHR
ncbi:hypothetical protein ACNKHQ_23955 [Shigella flexneri]